MPLMLVRLSIQYEIFDRRKSSTSSTQLTCDIRELALLKLCLPKYWVSVREAMFHPSFLFDMVQVDEATRVGISMCRGQNAPSSKLESLFDLQVVAIFGIEYSIRKCLTRSDAKKISSKSSAVRVNVVECRTLLRCDSSNHCSHRQTHTFVGVDKVCEDLRGGS